MAILMQVCQNDQVKSIQQVSSARDFYTFWFWTGVERGEFVIVGLRGTYLLGVGSLG